MWGPAASAQVNVDQAVGVANCRGGQEPRATGRGCGAPVESLTERTAFRIAAVSESGAAGKPGGSPAASLIEEDL